MPARTLTRIVPADPRCAASLPSADNFGAELEVLRAAEIFRGMPEEAVRALIEQMELVLQPSGAVVFRQGDVNDKFYVIVSGSVKLTARTRSGSERLTAVRHPGDNFGEMIVLDPRPRTATATVMTDARLARVSEPAFRSWVQERPEAALQMLRMVARRVDRAQSQAMDVACSDVGARVAKLMLEFAARVGVPTSRGVHVPHNLTQVELADLVASTRETVNKCLANFAKRGWVVLDNGALTIVDVDRVRRRAR